MASEPAESTVEAPALSPAQARLLTRDRLVYLTDAVVAIAMTLLALDLPVTGGNSNREVWQNFVSHLGHEYLFFAISFVVIARYWVGHHRAFLAVTHADTTLIELNVLWLLMIVLVPFATRLLGTDGKFILGPALYACVMVAVATAMLLMIRHALRAGLAGDGAPRATLRTLAWRMVSVGFAFAVSIPVAFANPALAEYSWIVLPAVTALSVRLVRRYRLRSATVG
jgi:uncharacterized membrane protein